MVFTTELAALLLSGTVALGSACWAVLKYVARLQQRTDAKINAANEERRRSVSMLHNKDSELSSRLERYRLEIVKEHNQFVTRSELDRRMDKMESILKDQDDKLDQILHRQHRGN